MFSAIESVLNESHSPHRIKVIDCLKLLPSNFILERVDLFLSWIAAEPCGPSFYSFMKCFQVHAEDLKSLAWPVARLPMNHRVSASIAVWVFALSALCIDDKPLRYAALHQEGRFAAVDRAFEDAFRRVERIEDKRSDS
ncbi:MAG: hypothetical protein P1V97_10940 [Planctomycetota bacterium]|nr:hypothetical protein [Planctomycetota bacterium]